MYRIIVKGESGNIVTVPEKELSQSDLYTIKNEIVFAVDCQDDFVEYMDEPLKSKLESGYMWFKIEKDKLFTITSYVAKEKLSKEELKELADYTQGQWSDGIGEGFEQLPCIYIDDQEVYLSPWYFGQKLEIKQNKIEE